MKPWSWQALCRVFVVFGLLWGNAQAQEATIKRATELREAPGDQAASRGALAADSSESPDPPHTATRDTTVSGSPAARTPQLVCGRTAFARATKSANRCGSMPISM